MEKYIPQKTVCLANLSESTEQEVFDHVVHHLLTQNEKAVNGKVCRYRATSGLKCAAGCLIGDNEYSEEFEGQLWEILVTEESIPKEHSILIGRLQEVHDESSAYAWEEALQKISKAYKLEWRF